MDLVDLFPKTIGVSVLNTLTPDLIQRVIEFIDLSSQVSMATDGTYTKDQQLLNNELFKDAKQEIIDLCKQLSQSYGHQVEDIAICNSWANVVAYGDSIAFNAMPLGLVGEPTYLLRYGDEVAIEATPA